MSIETAASKVPVSPEKLAQWESGVSYPTIRQAEALANTYQRPFALFFLPNPPFDFTPLNDFRRKSAKSLSTGSVFIIREIQQKQAWAREFYEDSGENALAFVGRFTVQTSPRTVAKNILTELNINPQKYYQENPMKEWIEKAEAKGIFISRTSNIHSRLKLDSEEFQGFVIADNLAPFIFINTDDWDASQLFTLVHEIAHIWINQSGISSEVKLEDNARDRLHPVEIFCNEVAANALLPTSVIDSIPMATFDTYERVYNSARHFGVSAITLLFRALALKRISNSRYHQLKDNADQAFKDYLKRQEEKAFLHPDKKGGPNPYMLRTNRNGHLFTKFVLDAFRGGFIHPTEASSLLSTPVNKFPQLESFVYA